VAEPTGSRAVAGVAFSAPVEGAAQMQLWNPLQAVQLSKMVVAFFMVEDSAISHMLPVKR
jgi:hypothetical protein